MLQVVDGLEDVISCGFSDQLVQIREKVADNVQTVLSSGNIPHSMYTICQKLLKEPICRVISDTSVPQCSAWISQNVQVLVSEDRRQQKVGLEHRASFFIWSSLLMDSIFVIAAAQNNKRLF